MTKLHEMSYDLIITGQNEESKRLIITIGDLKDNEAAIIAADITKFLLNRDYGLSASKRKPEILRETDKGSGDVYQAFKDIYRGGYTHACDDGIVQDSGIDFKLRSNY